MEVHAHLNDAVQLRLLRVRSNGYHSKCNHVAPEVWYALHWDHFFNTKQHTSWLEHPRCKPYPVQNFMTGECQNTAMGRLLG